MGVRLPVRAAGVLTAAANSVLLLAFLALIWWDNDPSPDESLLEWRGHEMSSAESALVIVVCTVGLGSLMVVPLGRISRVVAGAALLLGVALLAVLVWRAGHPPLGYELDRRGGMTVAFVAAIVNCLSWLTLIVFGGSKRCPDCAERVPARASDCDYCGHKFQLSRRWTRCPGCGEKVRADARLCRYCRTPIRPIGPEGAVGAAHQNAGR